MPFWIADGKLWYANRNDLEAALNASGKSEEALRRQLGVGYKHLEEALNGERLDGWAVVHLEHGLSPELDPATLPRGHSWPPEPTNK